MSSRYFKIPIYNDSLIRTKTVRGDHPLLHAIFHCVSEKYEKEFLDDKINIVSEIHEKMVREKWKRICDISIHSSILDDILNQLKHPLIQSKSVEKHIIPKIQTEISHKEFLQKIKDEFKVYIEKVLNKVKISNEERTRYFKTISKTITTLIEDIDDKYFKIFLESEKQNDNIDMVQTFFQINIYLLNGKTGSLISKSKTAYEKSIVLLLHSGGVYEAVGKIYKNNIKRVFDSKSSFVKALDLHIQRKNQESEESKKESSEVIKETSKKELRESSEVIKETSKKELRESSDIDDREEIKNKQRTDKEHVDDEDDDVDQEEQERENDNVLDDDEDDDVDQEEQERENDNVLDDDEDDDVDQEEQERENDNDESIGKYRKEKTTDYESD